MTADRTTKDWAVQGHDRTGVEGKESRLSRITVPMRTAKLTGGVHHGCPGGAPSAIGWGRAIGAGSAAVGRVRDVLCRHGMHSWGVAWQPHDTTLHYRRCVACGLRDSGRA